MKELIKSFDNQKVIRDNGYSYMLIPITDHFPATSTTILRQAVNAICDCINWNGKNSINKVVGEEEKGGFIAVSVALQRDLPFSLAKQFPVNIPGEIHIEFKMDYAENMSLYLNGVEKGDNVIIVDDIIATGGTMIALIKAIKKAGANIKDVIALAEKVEMEGAKIIEDETGIKPKSVLKLDTSSKRSKVVGTIFDKPRKE
ncbi:MAG: phosphoribosyltransferase family protein [Patescibacteria group bacterium]|nr:phosphoribosyltransferase family protein [Patescibacteria group bacterium]